jgi:DNA recombination protein RmuC
LGELVLERVLEKSGLEKDENMRYSKVLPPKETAFFPDVVINLPDGKKMIVDSKVLDRLCTSTKKTTI